VRWNFMASAMIAGIALIGVGIGSTLARTLDRELYPSSRAQTASPNDAQKSAPAYHPQPPAGELPETIRPSEFTDAETQNIYALAAKIKKVLYQQPCYCGCDKEVGHKSLLDCYVDRHAAMCNLCKKEAVFAYEETKKGKSPAEIRKEIMAGKWAAVDLSAYEKSAPAN
jgi:hypothetical protein